MNREPRHALAYFPFCDSALASAPAIIDDIQQGGLPRLRCAGDNVQRSKLEFDLASLALVRVDRNRPDLKTHGLTPNACIIKAGCPCRANQRPRRAAARRASAVSSVILSSLALILRGSAPGTTPPSSTAMALCCIRKSRPSRDIGTSLATRSGRSAR